MDSDKVILNCEFRFKYLCPKTWGALTLTEKENIRYCEQCERDVYYCLTGGEVKHYSAEGKCVAVKLETELHLGEVDPISYEIKL